MAKKENIASVTSKVFALLEKLESEDRGKVVNAALALLGEKIGPQGDTATQESEGSGSGTAGLANEKTFFNNKEPNNKIEELAVAARYREMKLDQHDHDKIALKDIFTEARRNFDSHNFKRDLENAKNRGLFTRGRGIQLSYYGQQYVDTLPDREALKQLRKPRTKKKAVKKKKG